MKVSNSRCQTTWAMSIPMTDADALDRSDMERLAAGHDAALSDLMERHSTPVFHFLCRMLGNEDDANDLAQEVFVRVYRSSKNFRANEKFTTWLYTIAANLARNQYRWRSRHPNVSLEATSAGSEQTLGSTLPAGDLAPSDQALASEQAAAVRKAVHELPGDMREVVVLCEWEDRSVKEVATILKTTPKAVESRLYRARQLLRKRLEQWF